MIYIYNIFKYILSHWNMENAHFISCLPFKKPQTQSPTKKESKKVGSSEDDDSDGDFGPLWDDDDSVRIL